MSKVQHKMDHGGADPKKKIWSAIGGKKTIEEKLRLSGHQVLVATYIRPEKTAGGLLQSATTLKEDEYQGKVGMIVAMGPLAFHEQELAWHGGAVPKIGDFVWYRVHDGFMKVVNGHPCRTLEDKQIRGLVPDPDYIL